MASKIDIYKKMTKEQKNLLHWVNSKANTSSVKQFIYEADKIYCEQYYGEKSIEK